MIKFYDTCSVIEGYSNLDSNVIISTITLEELEEIKTSKVKAEDVKFRARKALKYIEQNKVTVVHVKDVLEWYADTEIAFSEEKFMREKYINDDLIILSAKYWESESEDDVVFYSEDLLCKIKARDIWNLNVSSLGEEERNGLYTGYKKIEGTTDEINAFMEKYQSEFVINEYLIMHDTDEDKWSELRYNGETFVGLKLPPSGYIKGKNSLQRCALDMLYNKDIGICVIMGLPGSGKTHLATQMGLYMMKDKGWYERIVGIREYSSDGKEVGFLKGDLDDKLAWTWGSIQDQLAGGEYELESLTKQGKLINTIPYFIKGRTFDNSYIIGDEAEDMSAHLLKLCGTRVAGDDGKCKIVFSGDYKQSNLDNSVSNPLIEMCKYFKGDSDFACIMLDEDVRSKISRKFAEAKF